MTLNYQRILPEQSLLYREIRLESLQEAPESFGAKFEEQVLLKELRFESFIKQQAERYFVMGAFADANLVGITAFAGGNPYDLVDTGTIIQVYVKKDFSGQKIGYNLIKAILVEAFALDEIRQVVLEVNKNNLRAISVYEQAGFRPLTSSKASDTKSKLMFVKQA